MGNQNSVSDKHITQKNERTIAEGWTNKGKLEKCDIRTTSKDEMQDEENQNDGFQIGSPDSQCLAILDTVQHLPEKLKNPKAIKQISEGVYEERKQIIKKLREMADYLEKTHSDVLVADRVGTGVGIGSGALFIGGLIAAPFTAGLSLGLTAAGTATGVLGGLTSAGANLSGHFIAQKKLRSLENDLKRHQDHLLQLSKCDSHYLTHAAKFRPTIEQLGKLSESKWIALITTILKLVPHALKKDYRNIKKVTNHVVDPDVKQFLQQLPLPLDKKSLYALAEVCSQILLDIRNIRDAIKAFLSYLAKPELARLAMLYTNSTAKAVAVTAEEALECSTAFKGTPLAMTKTARAFAGTLTAVFMVVDVVYMIKICKETGATPTVQQLRKMANDLENEIGVQ